MAEELRLLAVLAHPDDESLGFGGTLAKYAAEGIAVHLVTATRGEHGRFGDGTTHPGVDALARIREAELRAAAGELGVREVSLLGYADGLLDTADPVEAIERIARHVRRIRPHVVVTFANDGAYGHPDHVAICQLTTAAVVAAAQASPAHAHAEEALPPHGVAKLYWYVATEERWRRYQSAFRKLVSRVDGVEREAVIWPDWMVTALIDTEAHWRTVWRAVQRHESQLAIYGALADLSPHDHRQLWGRQEFYRVYTLVNGGRARERDLFEGLR